jgi:hypothetical protein
MLSSTSLDQNSATEQRTLLNSMLGCYYDELDPSRRLVREKAANRDKKKFENLKAVLKKDGFKFSK